MITVLILQLSQLCLFLSFSLAFTHISTHKCERTSKHTSVTTHTCDGGNHRASSHSLTAELVSHGTLQIDETAAWSTPAFIELLNSPDWCEWNLISYKGVCKVSGGSTVVLPRKHRDLWNLNPLQRPWCWTTRGSVTFWTYSWVCTDSSSPAC